VCFREQRFCNRNYSSDIIIIILRVPTYVWPYYHRTWRGRNIQGDSFNARHSSFFENRQWSSVVMVFDVCGVQQNPFRVVRFKFYPVKFRVKQYYIKRTWCVVSVLRNMYNVAKDGFARDSRTTTSVSIVELPKSHNH